jgi:hypothetical protein
MSVCCQSIQTGRLERALSPDTPHELGLHVDLVPAFRCFRSSISPLGTNNRAARRSHHIHSLPGSLARPTNTIVTLTPNSEIRMLLMSSTNGQQFTGAGPMPAGWHHLLGACTDPRHAQLKRDTNTSRVQSPFLPIWPFDRVRFFSLDSV